MPEAGTLSTLAPRHHEDHVYGLLVLAGTQVALPLSALREVVPCPRDLSRLPVSAPGLLGAMELREMVVPVVDLGRRLGLDAPGSSAQQEACGAGPGEDVVVVVASGEHLLGIVAQAARGVVRVPASHLVDLSAEGGPLLFSHAFRGQDGAIVSVLDPERVVAMPGVPRVRDRPRTSTARSGTSGESARTTWTLLRCGDHLLALDVAFVHTTLPGAPPRASVVGGGLCLGVSAYSDLDVPVVDPLRLLGIGTTDLASTSAGHQPREHTGAGLVLRLQEGFVVLALSALVGLVDVTAADSMALPGFSVRRPDLLAGLADLPAHGPCLVLDGAALLVDGGLRELASTNVATAESSTSPPVSSSASTTPLVSTPAGAGATAPAAAVRTPMYLTYRAGAPLASRLEQVAEILPLPAPGAIIASAPLQEDSQQMVLGVVAHRGTALPVVHLPTLLGLTSRPVVDHAAGGCLLLVALAEGHVAFAVDSLHEIEPFTWAETATAVGSGDPVTTTEQASPSEVLRASRLVQVGGSETLMRDLDLAALAAAVCGPRAGR